MLFFALQKIAMDHLFTRALFTQLQTSIGDHYPNILQLLGAFTLLYAMFRYKALLAVILIATFTVYTGSFVWSQCVHGCVSCLFQKLVEQGICVEITAKTAGIEHTYFHCDTRVASTDALAELR